MTALRSILDAIDTPGGHIIVCILLIGIGAGMWKLGMPKGDDLIVGATGVLFAAMRGAGNGTKPPA
jgi:hypothetical protein